MSMRVRISDQGPLSRSAAQACRQGGVKGLLAFGQHISLCKAATIWTGKEQTQVALHPCSP